MGEQTELTTLSLAEIDIDGALRETAARLPTRAQFLRLGGGGALGGLVLGLTPGVAGARERGSDVTILNFALALEYLQAAFYTEAERVGALKGALADQARVVGSHERAHVRAFRSVLGSAAIPTPGFNFHGATDSPATFRATAVAFEDLAVAAYKEQLPKIKSNAYLATAVSIHSVEARHASWIRRLAGIVPAPNAFDQPSPDRRTVQIVNSTHFVTLHVPKTSTRHAPSFTG
jgi:hypothetical protein